MRYHTNKTYSGDGRLYFEDDRDPDNVAVFFANEAGGLMIAVSEEQPVDSYNQTFECCLAITREQATQLRNFLNAQFPG